MSERTDQWSRERIAEVKSSMEGFSENSFRSMWIVHSEIERER